ncbi:Shedu immune nuclease family protein [Candidatus Methylomicrobium oryzae]|uniref:Shedu immune nuclease family protein n=1 Tax=Candidatus Methylomicrobium oryzae TaxID=2802053 RepID=UPI001923CB3B|nr:Shedu immune nuclease family protein [Methylomicrobium sp. RS1]MBL1263890.1 DUF4263 domain-containing protein [Methylomicrobium sp. RS1]
MTCNQCIGLEDIEDLSMPYVVRTCSACNREITLREPGDNGHGIKVEKGDRFVFPAGFLKVSANPLKSTGYLTKHGLAWFAKLIFIEELEKNPDNIDLFIQANEEYSEKILRDAGLFDGLDLYLEEGANELFSRLEKEKDGLEWWAYCFGFFNDIARDAIKENDARKAAWAMRAAERCRSMCVFKESLEEVVWMGHSAGRIIEVIRKWHSNKNNNNSNKEEFWQVIFNENPYILSQVFSVPVVFLKDRAYVGGMNIEGSKAKLVDFLFANQSSNDALLVEIKTPATQMLAKTKYRNGVYNPTKELSGSILQVLNYRRELAKNYQNLTSESGKKLDVFNPKCLVIIGNSEAELDDDEKRTSFELYRTSMKDVEIVTFDELFKKAETLATLFNLVWERQQI